MPHYWCRVAALLSQTSRDHRCGQVTLAGLPPLWSTHLASAHERNGPPLWSSRGRDSKKAEGSWLPSGTDPRTGQRAPTQEPALLLSETCFCPGVLSPPCPGLPVPGLSWFRVAGSPALPLRVPVCFCSASCFFLLAAGVTFQLPAGGTSGQAQGHRPKNRYRAPTQGPAFTGIPLRTTLFCTSSRLSCSFPSALLFYLWWSWYCVPCILHCYNSDWRNC